MVDKHPDRRVKVDGKGEKIKIRETHVANFDIHVCLLIAVQELGDAGDAANVP